VEHRAELGGAGPSPWRRQLILAIGGLMLILPIVFTSLTPGDPRYEWRMFWIVPVHLHYEIDRGNGWERGSLDGLSWWDRGRHHGTTNLRAWCEQQADGVGVRRIVDGAVDAEVRCR
jgi:hypothetical protein